MKTVFRSVPGFGLLLLIVGCSTAPTNPASCSTPPITGNVPSTKSPLDIQSSWETDRGKILKLSDLRGQPCVFAMFFAKCEGSCVLTIEYLKDIEASLPPDTRGKTRFVAVTFDPAHDSASALAEYRSEHQLSNRWIILRGNPEGTAELARRISLTYTQQAGGRLVHSNGITIVNATGKIVHQQLGLHSNLAAAVSVLNQCSAELADLDLH
jgi:protein SCO1/2